jgi:hypothetical protein
MSRKIWIRESQLMSMIYDVLMEQNELDEYGRRGRWKPEWHEEDQLLAMYNYLYGVEELGLNKQEIMDKIIGSSVDAFNQQTNNFESLYTNRERGQHRESNPQNYVYGKYKHLSKSELKSICLNIIQDRLANPDIAVIKKKLGQEIGDKRDEIARGREEGLLKAGVPKEKIPNMTLIRSNPLIPPSEDEENDEEKNGDYMFKEDIKSYLVPIISRMKAVKTRDDINKLVTDLQFIVDYIDDELGETNSKKMVSEIRRIFKMTL